MLCWCFITGGWIFFTKKMLTLHSVHYSELCHLNSGKCILFVYCEAFKVRNVCRTVRWYGCDWPNRYSAQVMLVVSFIVGMWVSRGIAMAIIGCCWGLALSQKLTQVSANRRRLWYGRNWRRKQKGSKALPPGASSGPDPDREDPGRGWRKRMIAMEGLHGADRNAFLIILMMSVPNISCWALWLQWSHCYSTLSIPWYTSWIGDKLKSVFYIYLHVSTFIYCVDEAQGLSVTSIWKWNDYFSMSVDLFLLF